MKSELSLAIEFERTVIANDHRLAGSQQIEFKLRGSSEAISVEMSLFAVPSIH